MRREALRSHLHLHVTLDFVLDDPHFLPVCLRGLGFVFLQASSLRLAISNKRRLL